MCILRTIQEEPQVVLSSVKKKSEWTYRTSTCLIFKKIIDNEFKFTMKHTQLQCKGNTVIVHNTRKIWHQTLIQFSKFWILVTLEFSGTAPSSERDLYRHPEVNSGHSWTWVDALVLSDLGPSCPVALVLFFQPALFHGAYHTLGVAYSWLAASHCTYTVACGWLSHR